MNQQTDKSPQLTSSKSVGNSAAKGQEFPPKLQQLLSTMSDVDKVAILQIAHHYKMDLDDPAFLPMLLTQDGIKALEKAKDDLVSESEATVNFVLKRASESIKRVTEERENQLKIANQKLASELETFLKSTASDSENAMKKALSSFSAAVASDTAKKIEVSVNTRLDEVDESAKFLSETVKDAELRINKIGNKTLITTLIVGAVAGIFASLVATKATMSIVGPSNDDKIAMRVGYRLFYAINQNQLDEKTKKALESAGVIKQ